MIINDLRSFASKVGDDDLCKQLNDVNTVDISASFGTAGIRGIMGIEESNINSIVIAYATQAYADFILSNKGNAKKGIVIANDNRRNGDIYRRLVSQILNSRGIKTYVMPDNKYMATPLLSYLIRKLGAAGGVNITASHNPKEYNGFKVYDQYGGQLMPQYTKIISNNISSININDIKINKYNPTYIQDKQIDSYISELSKMMWHKPKNISVSYSPLNGAGIDVAPKLFNKLGIEAKMVSKEFERDSEFSHVKSPNPEDPKSYINAIKNARKHKADLAIVTDPDADRVGVTVKYKKRWKYLTGNDFSVIYTNYMLKQMSENNSIPKDAYIIKSYVSTDLVSKIAKKYKVEVREVPVGFKNIAHAIENSKGTFLFGFEESYGSLISSDIARDKDAFQGVVAAIEMASYYKQQGITLFDALKNIQKEFGIHRNIQFSKKIDLDAIARTFSRIKKSKYIGEYKVKEIIDFRKDVQNPHNSIKVILKDGSWLVVRPSGTEPKVKFYIQAVSQKNNTLLHSVTKEKEMVDYVDSVMEYFPDKGFSWKTFFKYTAFTLIMAGLLYFVFTVIYGNYKSNAGSVLSLSRDFKHSIPVWIFFAFILGMFFNIIVDTIMKYRLLKFHGQKVKLHHLIISSIMGSIISYLTPLSIGGDAIGYWYLRRKGFQRAPLASTFLTSTVLWQMKNIVLTAILLPMGLHMFKDILMNGDAASKSVLVIFIIGLSWDMFSIFMLWTLLMSKKIQEWCISSGIKLMEWIPFIIISDPGAKAAGYMSIFKDLRDGMKKIWKSPKVLAESMFYEVLPKLLSISALLNMAAGVIQPDLEYGSYWSQIVASDVVNTANSFSITPGSTGFVEFISLHIRENIFVASDASNPSSSMDTVMYMDIIGKFTRQWPYLMLSSILCIVIITGESRTKKYKNKNKFKVDSKKSTTIYKKIFWIWPAIIAGWSALIVLF